MAMIWPGVHSTACSFNAAIEHQKPGCLVPRILHHLYFAGLDPKFQFLFVFFGDFFLFNAFNFPEKIAEVYFQFLQKKTLNL